MSDAHGFVNRLKTATQFLPIMSVSDIEAAAKTLTRCADPVCFVNGPSGACTAPTSLAGQSCPRLQAFAYDVTAVVNQLLASGEDRVSSSPSAQKIPSLMNRVAALTECECSAAIPIRHCSQLQHVSVITKCVNSFALVNFPFADEQPCGLATGSGLTATLPQPNKLQDSPQELSLISVVAYRTDALFTVASSGPNPPNTSTSVIDISVAGARSSGIFSYGEEAVLQFAVDRSTTDTSNVARSCVFFNNSGQTSTHAWSEAGMTLDNRTTSAKTYCITNHLTAFAVLTDDTVLNADQSTGRGDGVCNPGGGEVQFLAYVGIVAAILALLAKVVIGMRQPTEHSVASKIVLSMVTSTLVALILFAIALSKPGGRVCEIVSFLLHFAMLSSVYWILGMSVHMQQTSAMLIEKSDHRRTWSHKPKPNMADIASMDKDDSDGAAVGGWPLLPYVMLAVVFPLSVVIVTIGGFFTAYTDEGRASCWLSTDTAAWAFVFPAAVAVVAAIFFLYVAHRNLRRLGIDIDVLGDRSADGRMPLPRDAASTKATVTSMTQGVQRAAVLAALLTGTWALGTVLLLVPCEVVWAILFGMSVSAAGIYIFLYDVVHPHDVDFSWLNGLPMMSPTSEAGSVFSGYVDVKSQMTNGTGFGATPGTPRGPIDASASGFGFGNVYTTHEVRHRLPTLPEVFQLFETISERDGATAFNQHARTSAANSLVDELPKQYEHYSTDVAGNVSIASGQKVLALLNARGDYAVGIFQFLIAVETMERARRPDESSFLLKSDGLLKIFSALNGLRHDRQADAQLDLAVSMEQITGVLSPMFGRFDTNQNASGAASYIVSKFSQSSAGIISLREIFASTQALMRSGWHAGGGNPDWHPSQIQQPAELYLVATAFAAFELIPGGVAGMVNKNGAAATAAGGEIDVHAVMANLVSNGQHDVSIGDFMKVLLAMKEAGATPTTVATMPVSTLNVPKPTLPPVSPTLSAYSARSWKVGGSQASPNRPNIIKPISPSRHPQRRESTSSIKDMRSVFNELDVNSRDVLTLDDVVTEDARRKLSKKLPKLFGTVSPTGERQYATAQDVISTLDPSGTGEVTVLDFMRAAREVAERNAAREVGSPSPQLWHNFPQARPANRAATAAEELRLVSAAPVSDLIDAANSKNASRAASPGDGPSQPASPVPAKQVVAKAFVASKKPMVTIASIMAGSTRNKPKRPTIDETRRSSSPPPPPDTPADGVPTDGEGYLVLGGSQVPLPPPGEPPSDGANTFNLSQEAHSDSQSLARSVTLLNMNYDVTMLTQDELSERISGDELRAGLPMALQQLGRSDEGMAQAPALIDMMEKQADGAITVQEFLRVTQPVWKMAMGPGSGDPRAAHFVPAGFHSSSSAT